MSKTDGGPAFPTLGYESTDNGMRPYLTGGMSLRDAFAAAALPEALRSTIDDKPWPCGVDPTTDDQDDTETLLAARVAYMIADAMLAERDK